MLKFLSQIIILLIITIWSGNCSAQDDVWIYLTAKDTSVDPTFQKSNETLQYTGSNAELKAVLSKYKIKEFKKTYRNAKMKNWKKTFFVICNSEQLANDLLEMKSGLFVNANIIPDEDKKIFEPNDYGLTSTIGENIGFQVNLDYLDFLGLPKAWYYTVGNPDEIVGISDGAVDETDIEFEGKTTIVKRSSLSKGHGYSIASIAAAKGDNGYGVPGVCYNCGIYATNYGEFSRFSMLEKLSNMGVKVINCSWGANRYRAEGDSVIQRLFKNGTLIVSTAGNEDWIKTKGIYKQYPASYDNVISVSSGMYRHEKVEDNIYSTRNGGFAAANIRGTVGRTMGFKDKDTLNAPHIWPVSTAVLNSDVDILAPTAGVFLYSRYKLHNELSMNGFETTSAAAPLVSGTVGLMNSLNPCLPVDEVESILKITAMNIDHIPANKKYEGMYGAGMLQTGDAVEMVYKLYTETETTYIEDQQFSRWDFKITALSEEVKIQNQKFTEEATLKLTARNRIVIGQNTVLKPNEKGSISLKIDSSLSKKCDLILRDPSIVEK